MRKMLMKCLLLMAVIHSSAGYGQSAEERFQDLFVTAGYSTAFGAALGAAMLAFTPEPSRQLRYIAMGASLGFIGGSIMGTYIIFTPMLSYQRNRDGLELGTQEAYAIDPPSNTSRFKQDYNSSKASNKPVLSVSPLINQQYKKVSGLELGYTLAIN